MSQFLGFGSGSDGDLTISSNTTEAPIDSAASTSGANLSATNAGFAANQMILVHQTQGSGAGAWEVNQIKTYVAGTITPQVPFVNTYNSGAQVRVLSQYKSVTVQGGFTWTAKAWNGSTGGILAFMCSGTVSVAGTISAAGCGFRAGSGSTGQAQAGEGDVGGVTSQFTANGNGGGGGNHGPDSSHVEGGHGGGGGNATSNTGSGKNTAQPGVGGNTVGSVDLISMYPGGGGGGGGGSFSGGDSGANGGAGGGIICIFAVLLAVTGLINVNGNNGSSLSSGSAAGGGSGAGGSFLAKVQTATLGSSLITASGGVTPADTNAFGGSGAPGGLGRVRIEACNITGDSSPASSQLNGGLSYCNAPSSMI